jgi:hypothetical protein
LVASRGFQISVMRIFLRFACGCYRRRCSRCAAIGCIEAEANLETQLNDTPAQLRPASIHDWLRRGEPLIPRRSAVAIERVSVFNF